MAYSDFTYLEAKRRFSLTVTDDEALFEGVAPLVPSAWLRETLARTLPLVLFANRRVRAVAAHEKPKPRLALRLAKAR